MKRTQIYVSESQDRRLGQRARATRLTKSEIIRAAIDAYLGGEDEDAPLRRFREALADVGGALPELPSGSDYVRGLRSADAARDRDIEERRRQ